MIMFKSEEARTLIAGWFERFRARLKAPTESRIVQTKFGPTHVLIGAALHRAAARERRRHVADGLR